MPRALAIDDDRAVLHILARSLSHDELDVETAESPTDGLKRVSEEPPDVLLLDLLMPEMNGLEALRRVREIDPRLPVVMLTSEGGSDTTIEAMQLGAFDYVSKPVNVPALRDVVERAIRTRRMMQVPVALAADDGEPTAGDAFIGRSPAMLDVFKMIGRVASQNVPVLVRGESGTGKELVARAIVQHGDRSEGPFAEVNCAALTETLLESELFGHEKGAFTGADARRIGRFEQCDGGTIFLDEVGDMSPLVQGKVLRLLQQQRFERVGGNETIQTDVRIVAATNRDLEEMVEKGGFRSDLLYRLNGVTISLPPLRERGDDLARLLQHFLRISRADFGKPEIEGFSPEAVEVLENHDWPGNVRELRSVVRQAVLATTGTAIVPDALPASITNGDEPAADDDPSDELAIAAFVQRRLDAGSNDLYAEAIEQLERFLIARVLKHTGGNQSRASEILGITRGKIRDRIAAFGISLEKQVKVDD